MPLNKVQSKDKKGGEGEQEIGCILRNVMQCQETHCGYIHFFLHPPCKDGSSCAQQYHMLL